MRILCVSAVEVESLTSGTQLTRDPLNSHWSSFSTAVFRSLAVSNSTNLVFMLSVRWNESLGDQAQHGMETHPFPCSRPVSE